MPDTPVIRTERLLLRLFTPDDAPELESYADNTDILATTSNNEVPKRGKTGEWIRIRLERFEQEQAVDFAVILPEEEKIIGTVGLGYEYKNDESMQLGYWIGKEYWNRGYCTEAAQAVLGYGFKTLCLHRIFSRHFTRNPASGRVLQKIGMRYEGTLREAFKKDDRFEDVECYGLLKSDYIRSIK